HGRARARRAPSWSEPWRALAGRPAPAAGRAFAAVSTARSAGGASGSAWASSVRRFVARAPAKTVPMAVTPIVEPIARKNVADAVATPVRSGVTEFWMASV